jgi:hypothetical protein
MHQQVALPCVLCTRFPFSPLYFVHALPSLLTCALYLVALETYILLTTECILLLQNVFSYYRMCSLTIAYLVALETRTHIPQTCSTDIEHAHTAGDMPKSRQKISFRCWRSCSASVHCTHICCSPSSKLRTCACTHTHTERKRERERENRVGVWGWQMRKREREREQARERGKEGARESARERARENESAREEGKERASERARTQG